MLFFFNDTATTEIYTLSLHDALPIYRQCRAACSGCGSNGLGQAGEGPAGRDAAGRAQAGAGGGAIDRKSTRLNSSHLVISYAVFCLKKKSTLTFKAGRPLPLRSALR